MAGRADGGYLIVTRDDGRTREYATATCFHCQKIIVMGAGQDEDGFCGMCMKNICGPCCDTGRCTPFETRLEELERREAARRALAAVLGV